MDAAKRKSLLAELDEKIAADKKENIKRYYRREEEEKAEAEHQRLFKTSPAYRNELAKKERESRRKLEEAFSYFRPAQPSQYSITEFSGRTIYYDQKLLETIKKIITDHISYSRHPELGAAASGIITDLRRFYNYKFPGRNPADNLRRIAANHPDQLTYTREENIYADYFNVVK
jgi:hypothetical protein